MEHAEHTFDQNRGRVSTRLHDSPKKYRYICNIAILKTGRSLENNHQSGGESTTLHE